MATNFRTICSCLESSHAGLVRQPLENQKPISKGTRNLHRNDVCALDSPLPIVKGIEVISLFNDKNNSRRLTSTESAYNPKSPKRTNLDFLFFFFDC